jgi:hypothetical protein
VVAIVDGTSDMDLTPKPPWHERKETLVWRTSVKRRNP